MVAQGHIMERIGNSALIAVVRTASWRAAIEISDALIEGGLTAIEITFTTPDTGRVLAYLKTQYGDDILLGAGTITNSAQAMEAADHGAEFLVSPGCSSELVALMRDTGVVAMPGALTPSEVMLAQSVGADAIKVFPGSLGGPSYLKALRGPFPETRFVPTGGVSRNNIGDWFKAGAYAVGAGSALVPQEIRSGSERDDLVENTKLLVAAAHTAM